MKHSGWRKGNRANRKSQLKSAKALLIILLSTGLLYTFPEIGSALEIEKPHCVSILMGSVPISSHHAQNKKHSPLEEGNVSADDRYRLVPQKMAHIMVLSAMETLDILRFSRQEVLNRQEYKMRQESRENL